MSPVGAVPVVVCLSYDYTFNGLGDTVRFDAIVTDHDGNIMSGVNVSWSSSNASVVSVSGGLATAVGNGQALVIASVHNRADTAHIMVETFSQSSTGFNTCGVTSEDPATA